MLVAQIVYINHGISLDDFLQMRGLCLDKLALTGRKNVTRLPEGLTVRHDLDLAYCTGLTSLPDGLTIGRNLDLTDCTALTALPNGLTVGDSIYLTGCTSLTRLPDGLTVAGGLNLERCTSLVELPKGLDVAREVYLPNCPSLRNVGRGGIDSRGDEVVAFRLASGIRVMCGGFNFSPDEAESYCAPCPEQLRLVRRALHHLEEIEARG
jgi:hypothetical protein